MLATRKNQVKCDQQRQRQKCRCRRQITIINNTNTYNIHAKDRMRRSWEEKETTTKINKTNRFFVSVCTFATHNNFFLRVQKSDKQHCVRVQYFFSLHFSFNFFFLVQFDIFTLSYLKAKHNDLCDHHQHQHFNRCESVCALFSLMVHTFTF